MPPRSPFRPIAALLAGLIAAGLPFHAPARADDVPRVLVAPIHVIQAGLPEALAPKVADLLADELHGTDGLQLVQPKVDAAAPKADDSAPPPAAQAALAQIEKGEAMVKKLKFKQGAAQIEAGLQDYEAFPAQVEIKKLREAYIQLAIAYMRSGSNEDGQRALADAVRLNPDAKLTGNYPPVFTHAYADAKKKTLAGGRGSLAVKGDGTAELDGKPMGSAPASADGILAGTHFLKVTRSDGSVWGIKVMVGEGANNVTVPPSGAAHAGAVALSAPELAPLDQNRLDPGVVAGLARLAKENDADFVLVGGIYKSGDGVGLATHLYSARTKGLAALKPVHFDTDLVSAGIEGNKLAEELAKVTRAFPRPGEALPTVVASELDKPAVAAVEKPKQPEEQPKIVLVTPPPKEPPHEVKPDLTIVQHNDVGALTETNKKPEASTESHAWIWAVAGGVALVGAGVGGFLIYKNQTQPVTGSASLNFQ